MLSFVLLLALLLPAGMTAQAAIPARPVQFDCGTVTEIPQTECEALVALYESTDGANWTDNTDWLATNTPCSWHGVTCASGDVTQLSLSSNQLSGSIPYQIGDLSMLTWLDLSYNQLNGVIPPEMGSLSNLTYLQLGSNQLGGSIPSGIANLTALEYLYLYNNQLSSPIPQEIGQLTMLRVLNLWQNQLTGDSVNNR